MLSLLKQKVCSHHLPQNQGVFRAEARPFVVKFVAVLSCQIALHFGLKLALLNCESCAVYGGVKSSIQDAESTAFWKHFVPK